MLRSSVDNKAAIEPGYQFETCSERVRGILQSEGRPSHLVGIKRGLPAELQMPPFYDTMKQSGRQRH